MDKPYGTLDRHSDQPRVCSVDVGAPFRWLQRGWVDMRENLAASVSYGLLFSGIGYFILGYTSPYPYLFSAAIYYAEPEWTTTMRADIQGFFLNPINLGTYNLYKLHRGTA